MKIALLVVTVSLIAGSMMSLPASALTDNLSEARLLQRVDQDQDRVSQALDKGAITQEQANADNNRISDVRAQISKTHKKYQGVIPHKHLVSINKSLSSLESKERSQEAETARHKPQ